MVEADPNSILCGMAVEVKDVVAQEWGLDAGWKRVAATSRSLVVDSVHGGCLLNIKATMSSGTCWFFLTEAGNVKPVQLRVTHRGGNKKEDSFS